VQIDRSNREGEKANWVAKIGVNELVDTLMYHCAKFNDGANIPEELINECNEHGVPGKNNSTVLERFLN